jgi:hypothetical protein
MWILGAAHPSGISHWVNANPGWIALIAAVAALAYVVVSFRQLRTANRALDGDREARHDAAMPGVVIEFTGKSMGRWDEATQSSSGIGAVDWDSFRKLRLHVNAGFSMTNYGPGPAVVNVTVMNSPFDFRLTPVNLTREPVVLSPTPASGYNLGVSVNVHPDGAQLLDQMAGQGYADVEFRWWSYSQPGTEDSASFTLSLEDPGPLGVGFNSDVQARLLAQPKALLVPGDRKYPTTPQHKSIRERVLHRKSEAA